MHLSEEEYSPYYHAYVQLIQGEILEELRKQPAIVVDFLQGIPEDKEDYAYAPGKWTVKQVIGHLLDTERIIAYRALRFARRDQTPLPGFNEQTYAVYNDVAHRSLLDLGAEFQVLRRSNLFLFENFKDEELVLRGVASGYPVSVRALLYIMVGHVTHHLHILKERYV